MSSSGIYRSLLVLDDERDLVDVIAEEVKVLGYGCIAVTSGGEALKVLREKQVTAVLSDFFMPEINGVEFLRQMRGQGMHQPVAFFTGAETSGLVLDLLRLGAADLLRKPCNFDELMRSIEHILELGARQEKISHAIEQLRVLSPEAEKFVQIIETERRRIGLQKAFAVAPQQEKVR